MKNSKLVRFRTEQKLTIPDMAKIIGISASYYEKIEYGDRKPSYNFLTKFKRAFPESDAEEIFLSHTYTRCVGESL
jgi:putative transcriptional regulator